MDKASRTMTNVSSRLRAMEDHQKLFHILASDLSAQTEPLALLTQWEHISVLADLFLKNSSALDRIQVAKLIFVLVLSLSKSATSTQKIKLKEYISMIGFQIDLGSGVKVSNITRNPLGISLDRFQLEFCGPYMSMDRVLKATPDNRVPFVPDEWQTKLLDIVDEKQSALICAPTSSGKTYVAYYAMQQILEANDTDIVVYVCPTKVCPLLIPVGPCQPSCLRGLRSVQEILSNGKAHVCLGYMDKYDYILTNCQGNIVTARWNVKFLLSFPKYWVSYFFPLVMSNGLNELNGTFSRNNCIGSSLMKYIR